MAFRYANRLAVTGLAAAMSLAVSMPLGAQEDEEVQEFDTFEVTGSRLKRTDFEGPLPVVQYSRDDIEAAGDITVSQFLRELPFNTFGSFEPESISGSGGQVSTDIDLRGLGSNRTLVILDGRRLPSSGQFSGAAQNLQILPLSAVERIEILKEGASAVYGSDAIGGVINIITRKDYQGVQFAAQVDRPTSDGGDGASYSFLGGLTGGNGSLLFLPSMRRGERSRQKIGTFCSVSRRVPLGFHPASRVTPPTAMIHLIPILFLRPTVRQVVLTQVPLSQTRMRKPSQGFLANSAHSDLRRFRVRRQTSHGIRLRSSAITL